MQDPIPTFCYLVNEIMTRHPDFAYIYVTEPRVTGDRDREVQEGEASLIFFRLLINAAHEFVNSQQNDFLCEILASRPFISAGGYDRELALGVAEKTDNLIAFGRYFLANVRHTGSSLFDIWLTIYV